MEADRTFAEWSRTTPRIKWSAVFAGWAVGLALQIVLTLAGLGFGAWTIDLHDANPADDIPVGAALWTGLSMLVSAFLGGYLTARLSGSSARGDGLYHGVVVWGINWLVLAWLTTTAMSAMIGGAFSVFGNTLQTVGQGLSQMSATTGRTGRFNLSVADLRREIESVISATGKPELQPEHPDAGRGKVKARQPQPITRITDQSLAEVRDHLVSLDRQAAITLMVNKYGMSDAQARDVVQSTIGLL